MSAVKAYAEKISEELGFEGEINDRVLEEAERRVAALNAANLRRAVDAISTVAQHPGISRYLYQYHRSVWQSVKDALGGFYGIHTEDAEG